MAGAQSVLKGKRFVTKFVRKGREEVPLFVGMIGVRAIGLSGVKCLAGELFANVRIVHRCKGQGVTMVGMQLKIFRMALFADLFSTSVGWAGIDGAGSTVIGFAGRAGDGFELDLAVFGSRANSAG